MSSEAEVAKANAGKGVKALQEALAKNNIKVDAGVLEQAVGDAHKAIVKDCSSCANGWHW